MVTSPLIVYEPVSSVCVPVMWTWSTCLIAARASLKIWSALLLASSDPPPEELDPLRDEEDELDPLESPELRLDEAAEPEPEELHPARTMMIPATTAGAR
jgi:hypothetical protein